jgi:hypothetical protein
MNAVEPWERNARQVVAPINQYFPGIPFTQKIEIANKNSNPAKIFGHVYTVLVNANGVEKRTNTTGIQYF